MLKRSDEAAADEGAVGVPELWVPKLLNKLVDGAADVEASPGFPIGANIFVAGVEEVVADEPGGFNWLPRLKGPDEGSCVFWGF